MLRSSIRASYRCSLRQIRTTRFNSTIPKDELEQPETMTIVPKVESLTKQGSYDADSKVSLIGYLQSRYLVEAVSNDDLYELTNPEVNKKFKLYCGADPTAKSLHLGNLLPLMVLLHFNLRGHDVVTLIGGATGVVGDPSGRDSERAQMEQQQRESNIERIKQQMKTFIERGIEYAKSRNYPVENVGTNENLNNADWWESIKMLDFLGTYGRHIRVSAMLGRDSIQSRLESQHGLGFNEFTYQILQAYDFWHMFKHNNVNIQVGGNDQWGNITAGIDLISRLQKAFKGDKNQSSDKPSYGLTVPLLTTPSGAKFGKSAGNAVFISKDITSPFQLYQYFINVPDEMLSKLLKCFTLLPNTSIAEILAKHESDPAYRIAQRVLAREVTDLVHGVGVGDQMAYITSFLFPTPDQPFNEEISADKLLDAFRQSGILVQLDRKELESQDLRLSTVLSKIMNKSKSETKNLVKSGGIYLGIEREQLDDPDDLILFDQQHHLIDDKLMLVRSGKQHYYVVEIV